MSDYTLSRAEILALALAKTDAGVILGGAGDWIEPRKFDCPNCGEIGADGVRQAVRDEVCLYVCGQCGEIARERLPFSRLIALTTVKWSECESRSQR